MADPSVDSLREARSKLSESIERNIERAGRVAAQLDKILISLSAGAFMYWHGNPVTPTFPIRFRPILQSDRLAAPALL